MSDAAFGEALELADFERPPLHRTRATLAGVLILLASLLAPIAIVGWYVRSEVVNTDRFVATVAPLVEDQAIQDLVVREVSAEVLRLANELQPGALRPEQVQDVAETVVASPQFQEVWSATMRQAHPQLEAVLLGQDNALVSTGGGRVVMNLAELARQVQTELARLGLPFVDQLDLTSADWQVTLFESGELATVQRVTEGVVRLVPWAVALTLVAAVLAVAVAPRRAVAVLWIGIGLLAGALLVGAGLLVGRFRYVAALPTVVPEEAGKAAFDILVEPLAARVRAWIAVALALVAAGILLSPWRRPGHQRPNRMTFGHWVAGHRWDLVGAAAAVTIGVLVWWNRPTLLALAVVSGVVAAVVVTLFLISARASA